LDTGVMLQAKKLQMERELPRLRTADRAAVNVVLQLSTADCHPLRWHKL